MPRVLSGTVPSAAVLNTLAAEIDRLSVACKVVRTAALAGIPANTDLAVNWQAIEFDTLGTMWDPAFPNFVTIQLDGTYQMTLQQRWGITGGSSVGQRAGKIMLNGTSVFANSLASDKRAASIVTGTEGVTLSMTAVARLVAGDKIYCNYWSSQATVPATTPTITGLNPDYGGTWLSVARQSPSAL